MLRPVPTPAPAPAPFRTVTVIVPTYREAESIPHLVQRLDAVRRESGLELQLLFVDDDSRDGSEALVRSLDLPWVRMIVRTSDRGLGPSVLEGFRRSQGEALVVMDADLSHPPEAIPALLEALAAGADVAVGSRFVEGGSTADDWGPLRWLNSRVATLLALPLTRLADPMSGFFALRRSTFEAGRDFSPVGYKILLELLVKCGCERAVEIPIHFEDRAFGESKLTLREQLRYLRHLRRLYTHRYGNWSHLAQFAVVGASGVAVNLLLLTLLLAQGAERRLAVALAIAGSMAWNFALNRRFSFSYARGGSVARQFLGFVAASTLGGVVNYATTLGTWHLFPLRQMAALAGVVAGTGFNFLSSRYLVFRKKHVRVEPPR